MTQHVRNGVLAALITQVVRAASAFVVGVVVARALGPSGRGEVALALTLGGFAVLVSTTPLNLGLLASTARSDQGSEGVFGRAARVAALGGVVSAVVVSGVHLALDAGANWSMPAPVAVVGGAAAGAVVQIFTQAWGIRGRLWVPAAAVAGGASAQLVIVGSSWFADTLTATTAVVGWSIGAMGVTMALLVLPAVRLVQRGSGARSVVRDAASGGVAALLILGVWRLDVVVLGVLRGTSDVGIYAVGVSIAEVVFVLLLSVRSVLLSSLGRDPARVALAIRLTLVVGAVVAVATAALAPVIITSLFGEEFRDAIPVAWVLVPAVVLLAAHFPLFDVLVARGDGRWLLKFTGVLLPVYLGAVAVSSNLHGPIGAAAVSAVTYAALFMAMVIRSRRVTGTTVTDLVVPRAADIRLLRTIVVSRRRVDANGRQEDSP